MPVVAAAAMTESLESLRSHEVLLLVGTIEKSSTALESEKNSLPFFFITPNYSSSRTRASSSLSFHRRESDKGRHALSVSSFQGTVRK